MRANNVIGINKSIPKKKWGNSEEMNKKRFRNQQELKNCFALTNIIKFKIIKQIENAYKI